MELHSSSSSSRKAVREHNPDTNKTSSIKQQKCSPLNISGTVLTKGTSKGGFINVRKNVLACAAELIASKTGREQISWQSIKRACRAATQEEQWKGSPLFHCVLSHTAERVKPIPRGSSIMAVFQLQRGCMTCRRVSDKVQSMKWPVQLTCGWASFI